MDTKKFKDNIWYQLGFLLALALICGLILGGVWFATHFKAKGREPVDLDVYRTVYGESYSYAVDESFNGKTEALNTHNGSVTTLEKVIVNDGAKIVKLTAVASGLVNLEMYIVVKNNAADYIYFTKTNNTWLSDKYGYIIENNKMNVSDIPKTSSASYTLDALTKSVSMAENA